MGEWGRGADEGSVKRTLEGKGPKTVTQSHKPLVRVFSSPLELRRYLA